MVLRTLQIAVIATCLTALAVPSIADAHGPRHGGDRDAASLASPPPRPSFTLTGTRQRNDDRREWVDRHGEDPDFDQRRSQRASYRDMEERCSRGGVGSIIGAIAGGLLGNGNGRHGNGGGGAAGTGAGRDCD